MNSRLSNSVIKAEAQRLGFFACGMARAQKVDSTEERNLEQWLEQKGHADMQYMAKHKEVRLDPRLLLNGAKTIVSVALNYCPKVTIPQDEPQMAYYAYGLDYHDIVKQKLYALAGNLGLHTDPQAARPEGQPFRVVVDTAPILERYWARQAGLGWQGKNRQLIIPNAGSMFFLGELLLTDEVDIYDQPMADRCGACRKCLDACPTNALGDGTMLDSAKCLSYITIENRNDKISTHDASAMGNCFYGCDRCQKACPHNRYASPNNTPELQPSRQLLDMTWEKWETITEEQYQTLFKGCAAKRAKYKGLQRIIEAIKGNRENSIK